MLRKLGAALVTFGPLGVFLLGAIDSFGIPLPATMDALLLLVAVKSPERAYLTALMAVLGSAGGSIALFLAVRTGSRRFIKVKPPSPGERRRFREWFQRYGLLTVFIPAVTPVIPLPLKFFVISAAALHTPTRRFIATIVAARVIRYFGEAWLGIQLGEDAQGFLTRNAWYLAGGVLLLAFALLLMLHFADRRRPTTQEGSQES